MVTGDGDDTYHRTNLTLWTLTTYSGDGDSIYLTTNVAVWTLTAVAAIFLIVRLYCRLRYSKVWWDDLVLTTSCLILLVAAALISSAITSGHHTPDEIRAFFRYHHASVSMTTIATSWTKVSFAITLTRVIQHRVMTLCLWAIIVTSNIVLILGILSILIPACGDRIAIFRPVNDICWPLKPLQYLGGTTIVYGGVIDILLALCPWFIIRKLLLGTREKIGLTIAMSLGAFTGTIVIIRAFYQFATLLNEDRFHTYIFMSIFNFLEPAVSIIAQTIPMFRVLILVQKPPAELQQGRRRRRGSGSTSNDVNGDSMGVSIRMNSPTSHAELIAVKSNYSLKNGDTLEGGGGGHSGGGSDYGYGNGGTFYREDDHELSSRDCSIGAGRIV